MPENIVVEEKYELPAGLGEAKFTVTESLSQKLAIVENLSNLDFSTTSSAASTLTSLAGAIATFAIPGAGPLIGGALGLLSGFFGGESPEQLMSKQLSNISSQISTGFQGIARGISQTAAALASHIDGKLQQLEENLTRTINDLHDRDTELGKLTSKKLESIAKFTEQKLIQIKNDYNLRADAIIQNSQLKYETLINDGLKSAQLNYQKQKEIIMTAIQPMLSSAAQKVLSSIDEDLQIAKQIAAHQDAINALKSYDVEPLAEKVSDMGVKILSQARGVN